MPGAAAIFYGVIVTVRATEWMVPEVAVTAMLEVPGVPTLVVDSLRHSQQPRERVHDSEN